MASYAIGDESDDEFDNFNGRTGTGSGRPAPPAAAIASTSSNPLDGHSRRASQAHQYVDDEDEDDDDPFGDGYNAGNGGSAGRSRNRAPLMSIDDGEDLLDYTGGRSANPQGTASDTRQGPGLYGGMGGNNSRYDVYDDDNDDLFEDTPKKSMPSLFGSGGGQEATRPDVLPYHTGSNGGLSSSAAYDTRTNNFLSSSHGSSSSSPGRGHIKSLTGTPGFDFDEDDEVQIRERQQQRRMAGAGAGGAKGKLKASMEKAWDAVLDTVGMGRQKDLQGERTIHINDAPSNEQYKYMNNYVSTGKYNLITFIPKFLAEQFSKYANVFFLFTACIMQIPGVSPTNRYTTVLPLSLVLLVAAVKEIQEDFKRHQSDRELNARQAKVLVPTSGQFLEKSWRSIKVGDIIRLESNDFFPADLILLSSSEPEGLCYIETSNLDGETNLKIKQANPATTECTSPAAAASLRGYLRSEQPNNSLYTYEGTLVMNGKEIPMDPSQMLLRGAQLRNTQWMYGLVVFTGHETKLMRNATATPIKRTAVERMVNTQILFLFAILLALSVGSAIGTTVRTYTYGREMWYVSLESQGNRVRAFVEDILTFIILYNNLIPISLIVTMEVVKFQQAILINSDLDMYHAPTDTPALCRTSSLVEELGQIEYVFSDKTGTLTQNVMIFRECSIAGVRYSETVDETRKGEVFEFTDLRINTANPEMGHFVMEFLTLLATCHTVIPENKDGKITYQASSPDEAALVQGADVLGYRFTTRKPTTIAIEVDGQSREYEVLNICEFNSTRKRMSAIVRGPDGKIKIYCKGADTVILERLAENNPYTELTLAHLEDYATEGLRTLAIAMREIPDEEYARWSAIYSKAAATINGRQDELDKAAELIETNLFLLGATAIEDKLQDGVPEAIFTLQQAGIKVWVLTGDRQETAINIGLSCRLISESMSLVIVNEENARDTKDYIAKKLEAIKAQKSSGDLEELALIIDGKSLTFALEKELSGLFLELAVMCKAVVCCRVSPLQKALVVKLVKKNMKSILLAIGDGANDVSMIQAAHVGIGISGVEGLQAARSADVAISQFRYLTKLLLVHGTWSYQRLSKLILYSFYKNIVLYMLNFWYAFSNSFSGQVLFESWTLTFYNVVFTVLPPVVLGVFDQFVSARMLDRYPEQYQFGQRNAFFNVRVFWQWIGNALYHSILIYLATVLFFRNELMLPQGWIAGQWVWGTTVYVATLLTVLLKAALISDLWTKYTVAAIPGSFVFTMVFLPLYQLIAPMVGVSSEYDHIVPRLWTNGVFWFTIFVLPILCLSRDFAWKSYKRFAQPEPYHIVQEIQKLNLPDYRPRKTQFSQAIKKIRALQRTRRNRGFAFSQTEESQEKIIRSYDTTIEKAKG